MRVFTPLILVVLTSCATQMTSPRSTQNYYCEEVVIFGRVIKARTSTDDSEDDQCIYTENGECVTLRSRWDMEIRIQKVLKGAEVRPVVNAHAIAHAEIRNDIDFIFFLIPDRTDYEIRSAIIADKASDVLLAEPCIEGQ